MNGKAYRVDPRRELGFGLNGGPLSVGTTGEDLTENGDDQISKLFHIGISFKCTPPNGGMVVVNPQKGKMLQESMSFVPILAQNLVQRLFVRRDAVIDKVPDFLQMTTMLP